MIPSALAPRPARLPRLRALLVAALLVLGVVAAFAPAADAKPKRPFVYAVVIDGLDGDAVTEANAPYISSLLAGEGSRSTLFPRSSSVIPAETNPNHTAMMSGAYPGSSGVAANAFAIYAPLAGEDTCRRTGEIDLSMLPSETSGENANCPRAEFTFEAIRRQGDPRGVVSAGIFGKPKLGRIFAGRNFRPGRYDADHLWAPCDSGADDDRYCESVPTNPATGYAASDSIVMDEVIRTVTDGVRKAGSERPRRPNFTFVNLPQVDSAGHATGTGPAYLTAIAQADAEIERLVTTLRDEGIWKRSVLMLVSDHSMDSTPQKISLTETFESEGLEGEFRAVQNGSFDSIYLADRTARDRFEVLRRMRRAALAVEGVDEALLRRPNPRDGGRRHLLDRRHPGWNSAGPRSGDLMVTSEFGYAFSEPSLLVPPSNPLPGNHGSPKTSDNFLAVTGGSRLIRQGTVRGQGRAVRPVNVDLAPTVMRLLGLRAPADSRGRFLARAFDRDRVRALRRR